MAHGHPQITSLLKGLSRQEPAQNPQCLPLTIDLLSCCVHTLRSGYSIPHIAQTLEAMFVLAFFGFLRCSVFTALTLRFKPRRYACISDLSLFSNHTIVFYLKRTKTNQSGQPTPVFYFNIQLALNPFPILANYLHFCSSQNAFPNDPLFVSESGQVITCFWFHQHFHHVLSLSGISPIHYSGHSFRIGAATSASCSGIPKHLIQIMGRWSFQAYHCYIYSDLKDRKTALSHLN